QPVAITILHVVAFRVDKGSQHAHLAEQASVHGAAEATAVIAEPAGARHATHLLVRRQQVAGITGAEADGAADGAEAGSGFSGAALYLHGIEQFRFDADAADVMEQGAVLG